VNGNPGLRQPSSIPFYACSFSPLLRPSCTHSSPDRTVLGLSRFCKLSQEFTSLRLVIPRRRFPLPVLRVFISPPFFNRRPHARPPFLRIFCSPYQPRRFIFSSAPRPHRVDLKPIFCAGGFSLYAFTLYYYPSPRSSP